MIFFDHRLAALMFGLLVLLVASVGLYRHASRWPLFGLIVARVFSVLLVLSTGLLLTICGCDMAITKNSAALYSPDHQRALQVADVDEGALGGDTTVTLFYAHGLVAHRIFVGGWKETDLSKVQWKSNTEISIDYEPSDAPPFVCEGTTEIKVECRARE